MYFRLSRNTSTEGQPCNIESPRGGGESTAGGGVEEGCGQSAGSGPEHGRFEYVGERVTVGNRFRAWVLSGLITLFEMCR